MSGSVRRSTRQRRVTVALDVDQAWHDFEAEEQEGDHADHSAECRARILVAAGGQTVPFEGQTGRNAGHAEMAALAALLSQVGGTALAGLLQNGQVFVECLGKPCCVHCSTMLGLMGVLPSSPATKKSRRTMLAGGAWGLTADLKKFVVNACGIAEADLNDFARTGQSGFDKAISG